MLSKFDELLLFSSESDCCSQVRSARSSCCSVYPSPRWRRKMAMEATGCGGLCQWLRGCKADEPRYEPSISTTWRSIDWLINLTYDGSYLISLIDMTNNWSIDWIIANGGWYDQPGVDYQTEPSPIADLKIEHRGSIYSRIGLVVDEPGKMNTHHLPGGD